MKLFIQATTPSGTFFRAGRMWTKDGTVVDSDDFTDADAKAIENEPHLKVRTATPAEIAASDVPAAIPTEAEVIDALLSAIPQMADDDFTKAGLPDMGKLRAAVAIDDKLVTPELRDAAMEQLVKGGFKAPLKA
ncbi:hypothetical protein AN189_17895 [Loktanella sp. 3ANDIMAR09]|uniref:hypothetical protein n=1 Tax=Loktanella sp. 3ANDIMAR09 TaxID=1225657 RepID=UPI0006FD4318|nr:hypothetical protein [Loktanella sp. 3ANDIMAR09]KQI67001.1 hypothetical protein AN189_17895 [Loktanella sp. 3ANDIMAR09]